MRNPYKLASYRPILGQASAKTLKGEKLGFLTGICYLTPDETLCPLAKLAGCFDPCLKSAGRGAFNSVQSARKAKTDFFYADVQAFMMAACADVWSLQNKARKLGMVTLVRLNGTSDIPWENIRIDALDGKTIFQVFPDVQFYDYTKHPSRNLEGKTAGNYDLTFSFSGITPEKITRKGFANPDNSRVAVVFMKREEIPAAFNAMQCIDGDDSDVRHIEPKGVVVALYAKGAAKTDKTGFVQIKGLNY